MKLKVLLALFLVMVYAQGVYCENIILIGIDTLRPDHMSLYGYKNETTPNLDSFSQDATVFLNATSPSSWTLPSFMSWFTSLYPSQHKVTNKYQVINGKELKTSVLKEFNPEVVTLAEALQRNGYRTAGFTGDSALGHEFGFGDGFQEYFDKINFGKFTTTFNMALDWIERNKNSKFFVFVHGYDMHGMSKLPEEFNAARFMKVKYKGRFKGAQEEYLKLREYSINNTDFSLSKDEIQFWQAWYDEKIYQMDRAFAEFIQKIKGLDILDKTIVVIASDHGNEFYEHKKIDHGYSLYEELIHVPLIIKFPRKEGKRILAQVRTIDIMPTILDILGIKADQKLKSQMQGVSLLPLLNGEELNLDAYSETDFLMNFFKRSLKTYDGWKLILSLDTNERELYNLNTDPKESVNLYEKEPRIAYELEQKLFRFMGY